MVAKHLHNFDTTAAVIPALQRYQTQAHALFHWLTYVNNFSLVEANGANWSTSFYSASDGVINSTNPQSFYIADPAFDATFVDKFIAIRDNTNSTNCFVARITSLVSTTEVTLDASAVLNVSATDVDFFVFDSVAAPPAAGDFFVIQNPVSGDTPWQARCIVRSAAPLCLEWELGFVGGWDVGTASWDLPVSTGHYMHSTMAQSFCVADDALGYLFAWSEDAGGAASDINALWLGTISPFHAPIALGVPRDTQYSAIFGTSVSDLSTNLSRDTTLTTNFVVGEMLDDALTIVPTYIAQKRLLSSGNDMMANSAASINPFSGEQDDYDAVVFHRAPGQAWRGRIPGVRTLNDVVANRTPLNSNNTYVLGLGIGVIWDGKAPLP